MTNKPNPAKPGSDEPFEPYPDTSPQQDDAPEHSDHPEDGGKPAVTIKNRPYPATVPEICTSTVTFDAGTGENEVVSV